MRVAVNSQRLRTGVLRSGVQLDRGHGEPSSSTISIFHGNFFTVAGSFCNAVTVIAM
jgi:hypothetical protein